MNARDHPAKRRFPAAGFTNDAQDFAFCDLQRHIGQRMHRDGLATARKLAGQAFCQSGRAGEPLGDGIYLEDGICHTRSSGWWHKTACPSRTSSGGSVRHSSEARGQRGRNGHPSGRRES